jgi:hypothetical protein
MKKIASPQELQAELLSVMAFIHEHGHGGQPDRHVITAKLRDLADRVAAGKLKVEIIKTGPSAVSVKVTGKVGRIDISGKLRSLHLWDDRRPRLEHIDDMTINRAGGGKPVSSTTKRKVLDAALVEIVKYWEKEIQGTRKLNW